MDLPMKNYLSIDAGGTFLKSAVLNSEGEVFIDSFLSVKSFSDGPREKIFQAFEKTVSKGIKFIEEKGMELGGICVAFPGPFDFENGVPMMHHKFQDIYGMNLRKMFYGISGVKGDIPIKFIHDANAVLSGELWKGNAQNFDNAAVVTLGTGLGFAISRNRKVLCNDLGGPLISIFKLPYGNGILEDYTAKRGFLKIYSELNGNTVNNGIKVSDIGERADKGEAIAIQTFKKVGGILAGALRDIVEERNIECLLFGGQISRSFHHLEPSLREEFKNTECLKRISAVKNISNAALLGAFTILMPDD